MIECPACGSSLRPGILFCDKCGAHVPTGTSLATEPLPEEDLPAFEADPWLQVIQDYESAELPAAATRLRITVTKSGRQVLFPLPIDVIYLGRGDAYSGISPDVDLAPDGGFLEGVSRRHARVLQTGNRLFIEDVGSANGTTLNDDRLRPYIPYPLREGDTLQLGKLELRVGFD
jgi:hypothetical protein